MVEVLAVRATPGVETVDSGRYRRSISVRETDGYFEVAFDQASNTLAARIHFGEPRSLFFIIERIRAIFDLNADWDVIADALRTDPVLARHLDHEAGLRVPGCGNGFELAVRAILEGATSAETASAISGRLAAEFGRAFSAADGITRLFPSPNELAKADLSAIGLPAAKADAIRALARAVCAGRIRFEGPVHQGSFLALWSELPGFTSWAGQ